MTIQQTTQQNHTLSPWIIAAVMCLILALAAPIFARYRDRPQRPPAPSDPEYALALAAANRFLHAWQVGDLENGLVLLSDGIRHSQNADKLEQFFSSPTGRAFEIGTGREHRGRYIFPVELLAPKGTHINRRSSELTLIDAGKNDWVVDKLP